jgi:hypothetical protein
MLGWGEFIKGELQLYEIPGFHQTVLEEPYVQTLAKYLRSSLDQAQAGNGKQAVDQGETREISNDITAEQAAPTGV